MKAFIKALSPKHLVITANRRLSSHIRQAFDQHQQQQGQQSWSSLNTQPLNSWLSQSWQQYHPQQLLLNDIQEQHLWQHIIEQNSNHLGLLQLEQTATLAKQAWQLTQQWQLDLEQLDSQHPNEQVKYFIFWARKFKQHCQAQQWISLAECSTILRHSLTKKNAALAEVIYFVGFDEISPQLQQLITALAQSTTVKQVHYQESTTQCQRINLNDSDSEITTFCLWAKQWLNTHPDNQIGWVVPELTNHRAKITNELTNYFSIQQKLPYLNTNEKIFNISASQSLAEFEAIHIALKVLQLLKGEFDINHLGTLLQSPYLCQHQTDADFGAIIDDKLRQNCFLPQQPLAILFNIIQQQQQHFPQHTWLNRWQQFHQYNKQQPPQALPSFWAAYFSQQLKNIGWPGSRNPNSLEYQLIQRFQQLLDELSHLDIISGKINLVQALNLLKHLTQHTQFQAQGNAAAPIQVLGLLESTGYQFDALWISGLHDESWPPTAKPNPFLPVIIQQQLNMPLASATRQLHYTQSLQQRLLHSANYIVLSSPLREGDKQLRPSKLIQHIKQIDVSELALTTCSTYIQTIYQQQQQETLQDQQAPPLKSTEQARGGSWILTEQATCPFRAFALMRLRAKPLPIFNFALAANQRGTLLHLALAAIWSNLNTQAKLQQLTDDALKAFIAQHIHNSIDELFNARQRKQLHALLQIEQQRLNDIIWQWLQLEKQRPPFSVMACEQNQTITIGKLNLSIQTDRIDQLANSQRMIIDYKTGYVQTIQSWFGERLQQPQLPLYCLQTPDGQINHHTSIAFAQIRADTLQFKGIYAEDQANPIGSLKGMIPLDKLKIDDKPSDWKQLQQHWQLTLTQLADEFSSGHAVTDPINGALTCQQCELQGLCRFQPGLPHEN